MGEKREEGGGFSVLLFIEAEEEGESSTVAAWASSGRRGWRGRLE